ncbi:unnamed protein product [Adineta ricciae]|uniref:F-box domain-containing protein n=1 Tax=Adineta ricciae TaxID=249248 RepID=A0A814LU76_ADIRI|nr:unnamed protein product [Adineta ricciae]
MNSTIETFPNELFIELFGYLGAYDLYGAFYNLNSRLNLLINSFQHLHLTLDEDWDNRPRTTPFFSSRVRTLTVNHDEEIDFSAYKNLRSLKLSRPTEAQCSAIQPYALPYLECLSISNFFFSDHTQQLSRLIFSPAFPRLHSCQIDRITFDDNHLNSSLSLRHLTITPSTWKVNNYERIFSSCPNLTHIQIIRLRNLSFKLPSTCSIPVQRSISSLYIRFYSLGGDWYEHIQWLLTILPHLETFQLIIDQNAFSVNFPFDLFARLLTTYVPNLVHLRIKLPLTLDFSKNAHRIEQLHSLFPKVQFSHFSK